MLAYMVRLATLSLRHNPVLSSLMVAAIGVGIAVSSTFVTIHHLYSGNPIPSKSDVLFHVGLDSWAADQPFNRRYPEHPPTQLTFRDMTAIMASTIPAYQSGMATAALTVHPETESQRPYREQVRMCYVDFFPMFEVPFRYGGGWDRSADQRPDPVVVIDAATNQKLFGGANSVGRTLRIEDRHFTIVGVLGSWQPSPRFYDPHHGPLREPEAIYMPFSFLPLFEVEPSGDTLTFEDHLGHTYTEFLQSEYVWTQMWVQLDSPAQQQEYLDFLDAYVLEQKRTGRFQRPLNNRLYPVMDWLERMEAVPEQAVGMLLISLLFLVVCSVNLIGLLLGKFLARAPEVGVRRALGASKLSVFAQHVVECEVVALLGGLTGLALSIPVLRVVGWLVGLGDMYRLDPKMIVAGLILSLAAGLIAGLYPAWRISRVAPAVYLKMQ